MNKKIIFSLAAVVVLGGIAAGVYFSGILNEPEPDPNAPPAADVRPYLYIPLEPVVMSFLERKRTRYLQMTVQMVTRDPETQKLMKTHEPMLRAKALTVASALGIKSLRGAEGKENFITELEQLTLALPVFKEVELELEHVIITGFVEQ